LYPPFGCGLSSEKQVQLIIDFAPDVIMATPSYMLNIAEEFVHQGRDRREHSLKVGIFGAEPWRGLSARRRYESARSSSLRWS